MTTKKPSAPKTSSSSKSSASPASPKSATTAGRKASKVSKDRPHSSPSSPDRAAAVEAVETTEVIDVIEVRQVQITVTAPSDATPSATAPSATPPAPPLDSDSDEAHAPRNPALPAVAQTADGHPLGLPLGLVEDIIAWKDGLWQDFLKQTAPEIKAVLGLVGMLAALVSLYFYLPFLAAIPFVTGMRETALPVLWGFATGSLLFLSAYLFSES